MNRRDPILRLALLSLTVLALPLACSRDGRDGRRRPAARATIRAVDGPVHHDVELTLVLRGRLGEELDVRVEHSGDGGRTFRPLAVSPPGPYLLSGSSTEIQVVWDSAADLGTGLFDAFLRVRAGPRLRAGPSRAVTVANYGYADAPDLADWALSGADPEEMIVADAWSFDNWAAGHLEGAISLPLDRILDEGAAALPYALDRRLVFYCGGGS